MGMAGAAEQPKPPTINNAESIAIRAVVAESKKLDDQQNELKRQYELIVADACQRVHQSAQCRLNQDGTLTKAEATKEKK